MKDLLRNHVMGVDPGGTTGIACLRISNPTDVDVVCYQVPSSDALKTITKLIKETDVDVVAVERFLIGSRASKARNARDIVDTMNLVGQLMALDIPYRQHYASEVKHWATDKRLIALGVYDETLNLPHARDALRHALFVATKIGWVKDPLSAAS